MASDCDVLIVGQGLAGSTLAWRLAARGVSVAVVDRGGVDEHGRTSASRVAAGLITPVTGKRMTVAADFHERWRSARAFYQSVEQQTGAALLDERPALRVFVDEDERGRFDMRSADAGFAQHARVATATETPEGVVAAWGAFVMPGAARLDVKAYLTATRSWLQAEGRCFEADLDADRDLAFDDEGVTAPTLGVSASAAVLCQGYVPRAPSWTSGLPSKPAKGEVLTVDAPRLTLSRVLHRGVWIAPCESGAPGRYRIGSTVDWGRLDSTPTADGRAELLKKLAAAGVTDARVVEHQAAVRPATPDRRPTFGLCPAEPRVGWLNGLGSKGSLWAPWAAERLAESLVDRLEKR